METPVKLYKLQEFMARTGLSRATAYREIANGRLKVARIGRSVRISEAEICRYIMSAESQK
jgi:excisionase family DNA binding protein